MGSAGGVQIGGYELIAKFGSGSVGTVYKARQLSMDRLVALKVLNPKYGGDPSYVRRFVEEARIAGRMNKPNVVRVYDVGEDRGYHYFSMEFVDGPTLQSLLDSRGKLEPEEALDMARQIARALRAAHAYHMVHRDVKPANILVSANGTVKLADLGLAKDVTKQTLESGLAGTPYYMAPEQSQGRRVDIRADIYSLGATLYHMLVGKPPFTGSTPAAVMIRHATERLTPLSELDRRVPQGLSDVVERMMAKEPGDRYGTPDELLADLDAAAAGRPLPSGTRSKPEGGRTVNPRMRTDGRRRIGTTASRRPVAGEKPGGVPLAPVLIGGGVFIAAVIIVAVFAFSGPSPVIGKAKNVLQSAAMMFAQGDRESVKGARAKARQVIKSLPATSAAKPVRQDAFELVDKADKKLFELDLADIDNARNAVIEGRLSADAALKVIADLEWRYSGRDVPTAKRDRVKSRAERARNMLKEFEGKMAGRPTVRKPVQPPVTERPRLVEAVRLEPAEVPREGPKDDLALIERDFKDLLAAGRFADADSLLQAAGAAARAGEKDRVGAMRTRLQEKADAAFDKVLEDAGRAADGGDRASAEATLRLARGRLGFEPYGSKIEEMLKSLQERPPGRKPTEKGEPRRPATGVSREIAAEKAIEETLTDVASLVQKKRFEEAADRLRRLEEDYGSTRAYARRMDEVKGLLSIVATPDATSPEEGPEAPVAAGPQIELLTKLGFVTKNGDWSLKEDGKTIRVVCNDNKNRARLIHEKMAIVDLGLQFDARIISGAGMRVLFRWSPYTDRSSYYYYGRSGKGYAVAIQPSQIRLQSKGLRSYYYYYSRRDEDGFRHWQTKPTRGMSWNRYQITMQGSYLSAVVHRVASLSRKDETFISGRLLFEFLPGEVELRNIKVQCR